MAKARNIARFCKRLKHTVKEAQVIRAHWDRSCSLVCAESEPRNSLSNEEEEKYRHDAMATIHS